MFSLGIHFKKVEILENLNVALSKSGLLYVDGLTFVYAYNPVNVSIKSLLANYFSNTDLQVFNSMTKHNLIDQVLIENTYNQVVDFSNLVDLFLILEFLFSCKFDVYELFSAQSFIIDFELICQLKRDMMESQDSIQDIYNEIREDMEMVKQEKYASFLFWVDKFQSQASSIQKDIDFKMNLLKLKRYLKSQACISTYCN
jgi:hypothetical protein